MEEIWKDITDYEKIYQVSNIGRVRSLNRLDSIGKKRKGNIMKISIGSGGYFRVNLCKNGKRKPTEIHRLVAKEFVDNPKNEKVVNHMDGIKTNNIYTNLEWCSLRDNNIHAYENDLLNTKLSKEDIAEIRRVYIPRHEIYGLKALAKKYKISSVSYFCKIVNNRVRNYKEENIK